MAAARSTVIMSIAELLDASRLPHPRASVGAGSSADLDERTQWDRYRAMRLKPGKTEADRAQGAPDAALVVLTQPTRLVFANCLRYT
jgi:hypothetical protein